MTPAEGRSGMDEELAALVAALTPLFEGENVSSWISAWEFELTLDADLYWERLKAAYERAKAALDG